MSHAKAELKQSSIKHASEMFKLCSEHDALQKAINKGQSELSQLRAQYDDVNNRMQISKSQVMLLKQCIRQNDEILKRKDNDINELEYARDALEETLFSSDNVLAKRDEVITSLTCQLRGKDEDVKKQSSMITTLEESLSRGDACLADHDKSISFLNDRMKK